MATYKPIQSIVLSTSASSVLFSGIPQDYSDLIVVVTGNTASGGEVGSFITVGNNSLDTGSNYSMTEIYGNGTSAASYRDTSRSYLNILLSTSGTSTTNTMLQFINYSNSTTFKTVLSKSRAPSVSLRNAVGLWRSTSAINIISIAPYTGSWASGTTFDLYGIGVGVPKATGGNISSDGNYWYHTFTASGSLVTSKALTCDVLSVGGGGGGGWNNAGGGGGGEVDILSGLSIASGVTKTVTIGGGGATATSTSSAGANGVTTTFASDTSSLGGGGGGTGDASAANQAGQTGGSGGGGALGSAGGSASGSNTNIGATGFAVGSGPERYAGGGGGGATSAGGAANTSTRVSGAGGQGYALSNIFSGLTISGLTHFGSGGSGGIYVNGSTGTAGTAGTNAGTGGQQTSSGNVNPTSPTINGGGGGGGGSYVSVNSRNGSNGASGIVIVRYPV
jgi:hypothetical protein